MKKIFFLLLYFIACHLFQMPSGMPSLIQNIFWIKCLIIKLHKNNWMIQQQHGKKKLTALQQELDKMYKDYDAEQVMLSDDLKKKREDQLFNKRKSSTGSSTQTFWF